MARLLIASGGPTYAHDHAATAEVLQHMLREDGHEIVTVTNHPSELPDALTPHTADARPVDGIVMHTLWWQMLLDRYDHLRNEWSYTTSSDLRTCLTQFVELGGGLVALHTASICFDDWRGWGDILGAQWNWERSFHPVLGRTSIRLVHDQQAEGRHLTEGLDDYATIDEIYAELDVRPDVEPLAYGRHDDGSEHPVLWVRTHGAGRVVHFALGHNAAALMTPTTRVLLARCTDWAVQSSVTAVDGSP